MYEITATLAQCERQLQHVQPTAVAGARFYNMTMIMYSSVYCHCQFDKIKQSILSVKEITNGLTERDSAYQQLNM